jgi:hypothetical protein
MNWSIKSFMSDGLFSDFFMYYWKMQDSRLRKSGAAHVSFERIRAHDENEFKRLEVYLGFAIGREGFDGGDQT